MSFIPPGLFRATVKTNGSAVPFNNDIRFQAIGGSIPVHLVLEAGETIAIEVAYDGATLTTADFLTAILGDALRPDTNSPKQTALNPPRNRKAERRQQVRAYLASRVTRDPRGFTP